MAGIMLPPPEGRLGHDAGDDEGLGRHGDVAAKAREKPRS